MMISPKSIIVEPEKWGKTFWDTIETVLYCYDTTDPINCEAVHMFLFSLQYLLPCPTCRNHYSIYFNQKDIVPLLLDKKKILEWIYHLQNQINQRNEKQNRHSSFEKYLSSLSFRIESSVEEQQHHHQSSKK